MRLARSRRGGIAVVIALVTLTVLGLLLGETARQIWVARRMFDDRECLVQARRWADSGIELAIASLRANAEFKGETVTLPDGQIVIEVTNERIRVRATNSLRSAGPVTIERTRNVNKNPP